MTWRMTARSPMVMTSFAHLDKRLLLFTNFFVLPSAILALVHTCIVHSLFKIKEIRLREVPSGSAWLQLCMQLMKEWLCFHWKATHKLMDTECQWEDLEVEFAAAEAWVDRLFRFGYCPLHESACNLDQDFFQLLYATPVESQVELTEVSLISLLVSAVYIKRGAHK